MKCQAKTSSMTRNRRCTRKAVYRTGSDGFGAKSGMLVCDSFVCRMEASNGYPVTFHAAVPAKTAAK